MGKTSCSPAAHNTVFIVAAYPRMLAMAFKPSRCTKRQARQVTLNGLAGVVHRAYFSVGWVEW
jgi:hypothetical protein